MLVEGARDGWTNVPPEMLLEMKREQVVITTNGVDVANPVVLKKFASGRVMGTLVYPNALAGAVLLLLPLALTLAFGAKQLRPAIRAVVIAMTCFLGGAGFFWTGSKLGWLIAMATRRLVFVPLEVADKIENCRARRRRRFLASEFSRFAFTIILRRAPPARARVWIIGAPPSKPPRKIRWSAPGRALSSGLTSRSNRRTPRWPGSRTTITSNNSRIQAFPAEFFIRHGLFSRLSRLEDGFGNPDNHADKLSALRFAIFIGLLGWFVQGIGEFSLYIPALAWTAFTLLGCSLAQRNAEHRLGAGQ